MKMTSTGMNLFCKSAEDFNKVKNLLVSNKQPFFTHDSSEKREYKEVIKGLLTTDEALLEIDLEKENIRPISARQIIPKKPKFKHQAVICHWNYFIGTPQNFPNHEIVNWRNLPTIPPPYQLLIVEKLLGKELNQFDKYCNKWRIKMNASKCCFLPDVFYQKKKT